MEKLFSFLLLQLNQTHGIYQRSNKAPTSTCYPELRMNEIRKQDVSSEAAELTATFTGLTLRCRRFTCGPAGPAGSWMPVQVPAQPPGHLHKLGISWVCGGTDRYSNGDTGLWKRRRCFQGLLSTERREHSGRHVRGPGPSGSAGARPGHRGPGDPGRSVYPRNAGPSRAPRTVRAA